MATPLPYSYHPLPDGDWIRLLELLPGHGDDTLRCRLLPVRLSEKPVYETLSYVWGDPSNPIAIQCDEGILRIGQSLHAALRKLRLSAQCRTVWADAISINQSSTAERGHQVGLMGQIYWNARHLNIWLGPDEKGEASAVFSLIRDAAKKIRVMTAAAMQSCLPDVTLDEIFDGHPAAVRTALQNMLFLPWFYRVWIVQESGLSEEAMFLWGNEALERSELLTLVIFLHENRETLLKTFRFNLTWFYLYWQYSSPTRRGQKQDTTNGYGLFLDCLILARALQATDPRDRVFAFLAYPISTPQQGDLRKYLDEQGSFTASTEVELKPDYSKTTAEIYRELGMRLIMKMRTFHLLSAVRHETESIADDFPSWIPRWDQGRLQGQYLLPKTTWYNTSKGAQADMEILVGHHLKLRGLILDTIRGCSSPFQGAQFLFDYVSGAGPNSIRPGNSVEELLEAVGPTLSSMPSPYSDVMQALALTLTDGMMGTQPGETDLAQFEANFSAYRIAKSKQLKTMWPVGAEAALRALEAKALDGDAQRYSTDAFQSCNARKFFFTVKGYLGLGLHATKPGDLCCVLYGSPIPFILRATGTKGQYQFVGEAYCQGIMRGEAMDMFDRGELIEEDLILR